jgi:hypothetical protein
MPSFKWSDASTDLGLMQQVTGVDSTVSEVPCVKWIGFLSFGHWTPAHHFRGAHRRVAIGSA